MGASTSSLEPDRIEDAISRLNQGDFDEAMRHICHRQRLLKWEALPERIVMLRHGESEGNINRNIYSTKGDAHLELTPKGLMQAEHAGERLRQLFGDHRIFVVVSPFERTQQTLLGLYRGGLDDQQVHMVHVSSQIREQEFGNFQHIGLHEAARAEQAVVGRFYYRRPNAESSADVYDRVSAFWDELLTTVLPKHTDSGECFDSCLIVTHGLTLRLALMKVFQWSVETFETVWNVANCEHVTLRKNMDKMCYEFDIGESFPQEVPWATRKIWVVFKSLRATKETEEKLNMLKGLKESQAGQHWQTVADLNSEVTEETEALAMHGEENGKWLEIDRVIDQTQNARMRERSLPFTVLDYLTLRQPRTVQTTQLNGRLVEGHHPLAREEARARAAKTTINWDDVEFVDWWGTNMSYQGKMLRTGQSLRMGMGMDDPLKHPNFRPSPRARASFTRDASQVLTEKE